VAEELVPWVVPQQVVELLPPKLGLAQLLMLEQVPLRTLEPLPVLLLVALALALLLVALALVLALVLAQLLVVLPVLEPPLLVEPPQLVVQVPQLGPLPWAPLVLHLLEAAHQVRQGCHALRQWMLA